VKLFLGSFKTREEAACCWDAAARKLYGWREATTNLKLGLIAPKVRCTKVCRLAARVGKRKIEEHRNKLWMAKSEAYRVNPTTQNLLKLGKQVFRQPPVLVKLFATGAEVFVEPQVPVVVQPIINTATADPKREKKERRAARRTRKLARQELMRRRRERAAAAMAGLDAEEASGRPCLLVASGHSKAMRAAVEGGVELNFGDRIRQEPAGCPRQLIDMHPTDATCATTWEGNKMATYKDVTIAAGQIRGKPSKDGITGKVHVALEDHDDRS
jgi:hypothetical protein